MLRPFSPEFVLFSDFKFRISLGTSMLFLSSLLWLHSSTFNKLLFDEGLLSRKTPKSHAYKFRPCHMVPLHPDGTNCHDNNILKGVVSTILQSSHAPALIGHFNFLCLGIIGKFCAKIAKHWNISVGIYIIQILEYCISLRSSLLVAFQSIFS